MILAGDIGATNSRLAFFTERGGRLEPVAEATYVSRDHPSLEAIVRVFVSTHHLPIGSQLCEAAQRSGSPRLRH